MNIQIRGKASPKRKMNLVVTSLLSRLTDFQLQSNDKFMEDYCEDLRECIVNFENKKVLDHCEKCGCNEFLCGHNKR
jgi:hypothetical protein